MGKSYSKDLRERVLQSIEEGMSKADSVPLTGQLGTTLRLPSGCIHDGFPKALLTTVSNAVARKLPHWRLRTACLTNDRLRE
jgi:hypothetical protein